MDSQQKYIDHMVDPKAIPQNGDILFVLVDGRVDMLGWFIKWWTAPKDHTQGSYNHAMMMRKAGQVVTQTNVFKEITIDAYLDARSFLKFWRIKNLTDDERTAINAMIDKRLAMPWWKRMYDLPGLIGQSCPFLHWFQTPGLWFCSESASAIAQSVPRFKWMPKEPSPSDLNTAFTQHPDDIEPAGYWLMI